MKFWWSSSWKMFAPIAVLLVGLGLFLLLFPNAQPTPAPPAAKDARWDPCGYIYYRDSGLTETEQKQLHTAVNSLSRASGLRFIYKGPVTEKQLPSADPEKQFSLLLQVSNEYQSPELAGDTAAVTSHQYSYTANEAFIETATVTFDRASFSVAADRTQKLIVHELGHAIGAEHSQNLGSVMHISAGQLGFTEQDAQTFAALGEGKCKS